MAAERVIVRRAAQQPVGRVQLRCWTFTTGCQACLLAALRAYQLVLSPWFGGSCRFTPSCSEYARLAVAGHGPLRGSWLALRRLARCHPLARWGYDPVPSKHSVSVPQAFPAPLRFGEARRSAKGGGGRPGGRSATVAQPFRAAGGGSDE